MIGLLLWSMERSSVSWTAGSDSKRYVHENQQLLSEQLLILMDRMEKSNDGETIKFLDRRVRGLFC